MAFFCSFGLSFPSGMVDQRIDEIRKLLPKAMLPDWVRLGSRLVRLVKDQHHPAKHDAILERIRSQVLASVDLREHRRSVVPKIHYPQELPITRRKDEIVQALRDSQALI